MQQHRYSVSRLSPEGWEHLQRCKRLPALQPGESERLMAAFLAGRSVTLCPPRYAAPVEQQPATASQSGHYGGARVSFPR